MDTQQPAANAAISVYSGLAEDPLVNSRKTLSISWEVYKRQWKSYVGLVLLMFVSFLIPIMAVVLIVAGGAIARNATNAAAVVGILQNMDVAAALIAVLLAIPFILWLILLGYTGVLLPGFADERTGIGAAFKYTWRRFRSLLWVAILNSVIVAVGLILFIVPGIIWGIYYSLSLYTCAFEEKRGMDALRRSKELVKGYVWMLIRRWAFWMYFAIFANIIASIPFLNIIGIPVTYFILTPLGYIYWFALYLTIRERKNRGLATDRATGKQKMGTALLLVGPVVIIVILAIIGFAFNNPTNRHAEPPPIFDGGGEA